jgi:hypothetical protein
MPYEPKEKDDRSIDGDLELTGHRDTNNESKTGKIYATAILASML